RLEAKDAPVIVVVGCAEGYYAIGLKRRLPHAKVYAIDTNEMALTIARTNAALNGVLINFGGPTEDVFVHDPALIIMDCEGAEVDYLDLEKYPALASAHIILEVHNLPGQETDKILLNRMRGTHRINMIFEGPRHPAKYQLLCHMPSEGRWLAVSEGRPCLMAWFDMTPRGLLAS
ncbi:MAG TPA: class I SAM-dependent methyltransferase, partial [Candidatus Paceibacterota bacterium]|nr:class I SAM-dependent methyltransferase [Candidatus Paceibacterota bacterium]